MKERFYHLIRRNEPFFCAVLAFLYGMSLVAALCHNLPQPEKLPLLSALSAPKPFLALIADYSGEVKLFLPMAMLSLWVSHPLFAYLFLFVRGVYCGFSSAALFLWKIPLSFSAVYLVLHVTILVAYTATVYCLLPVLKTKKKATFAFPFLFYAGILFLLCIIRNLVYYLFLK